MSEEQVQAIADAVAVKLSPPPPKAEPVEPSEDGAYFDEQEQKVIYTDEAVKAADEAMMDCLRTLPKGVVCYKGRGGSQIVNHSQESLEAIDNWKKNRRQWKTRTMVR